MAFGILQNRDASVPPGTIVLGDVQTVSSADGKTTTKAEILLSPRPSQSPLDPLNWSRFRKEVIFMIVILGACGTGVIGPVLVPGFGIIAAALNVTLTQVTLLNGSLVIALGVSSYICSALATVYGKRLIYIATTIILVATSCWGAAAQSYTSLLVARVFQGLGMGGFFALAGTATVNDLYFVHERGRRVGLWNFAVIVSVNVAPVISGQVIVGLSWQWSFWLLAILFGLTLVLVVLLFPETTFNREEVDNLPADVVVYQDRHRGSIGQRESEKVESGLASTVGDFAVGSTAAVSKWRVLLGVQNLQIGDKSAALKSLISPFGLLRHPAVIWGCCMWAVTFTWVIIQGAVAVQIFSAPPYNLSATSIGNLIGIAPLIGSALGTVFGGVLSDYLGQLLAKLNKGIYEPEFRLLLMIPFLLTFVAGGFGLGMAVQNELSAITCGVFLAILNFAIGVGCTGIVAYSNDTCQHRAGEAFGIAMLVKSAFAFGLTFMLNDYYASNGPQIFFFTWAGLTVAVTLFTVPLYVYGKRIRQWSARANIL